MKNKIIKFLQSIRARYRFWKRDIFMMYTVDDGTVYMNIAKTGFFRPLRKQHRYVFDVKEWEARHNTSPAVD